MPALSPLEQSALRVRLLQLPVTPEGTVVVRQALHLVGDTAAEREMLKNNTVLRLPQTRTLLSLTPNFIPRANPLQWFGRLGLEKALACLASRVLFAWRRKNFAMRRQREDEEQRALGLLPWRFLGKNPAGRKETEDLYISLEAPDALVSWMRALFVNGEQALAHLRLNTSTTFLNELYPPNISIEMQGALSRISKMRNEVGYLTTDKNLGASVYLRETYQKHLLKHLNDHHTYRKVPLMDGVQDLAALRQRVINGRITRITRVLDKYKEYMPSKLSWLLRATLGTAPGLTKRPKFKLASFYTIFKIHKDSLASRPIQPTFGTPTEGISKFVHDQLWHIVARHPFVLRNSAEWRVGLEETLGALRTDQWEPTFITFDVVSLYPSISHKLGLAALRWFLDVHCTSIEANMRDLICALTEIVIKENYLEHPSVGILLQICGTAMGTTLSVVYAIIFMIWFEEPVVRKFKAFLPHYKRYIDDGATLFVGPPAAQRAFIHALNTRCEGIKVADIQIGTEIHILDCYTALVPIRQSRGTQWRAKFSIYRKPLNAYMYLPYSSAHHPAVYRAWIKAELTRYIILSSSREEFENQVLFFAGMLAPAGYPGHLLHKCITEVGWKDRAHILQGIQTKMLDAAQGHAPLRSTAPAEGCVLTLPYIPLAKEWLAHPEMKRVLRVDHIMRPPAGEYSHAAVAWAKGPTLGSLISK